MGYEPRVEIDLAGAGKQVGRVVFPLDEPFQGRSEIALPVCVIANGKGPAVSLWGGNHGDEYEGPTVMGQLARELDPAAVEGRLLILPAINPPALQNRSRTSPIDGKNMNRVWPGDPQGTITERIVAWLADSVLPASDVLMDCHTGGDALELIPMSMSHHTDDAAERARITAAHLSFNAPLCVELRLGANRATAAGCAHERGLLVIGSESGGGHPVSPASLANCYFGIRNTLAHLEMLPAPPAPGRPRHATRFTRKWGHQAEMLSDSDGIFIPFRGLWDEVEEGEPAGQIIPRDQPFEAPRTLHFPASGLIAGRAARSGVAAGDVLYWVVRDAEG